jgi:hypothetical protein
MIRRATAARAAAGDPYAAKMQAAQERAEAEQRVRDRLEGERLRRLLALSDAKEQNPDAAAPNDAPKKRERKRRPDPLSVLKAARKRDVGPVTVSVTDPNGFTLTLSSSAPVEGQPSVEANPWDEVSRAKHH